MRVSNILQGRLKIGFSWPAFFFGLMWMLICKLWGKAGLWFGLYLIATIVEKVADTTSDEGLQVIVYLLLIVGYFTLWLIPAFQGNAWRVSNLLSRGFAPVTTVRAETKDSAIAQASQPTVA